MKRRNRQLRGSWVNINDCLNRASSAVVEQGIEWYPIAHSEAINIGNLAGYGGNIGLRLGAGIIARCISIYNRDAIFYGINGWSSPQTTHW